MQIVFSEMVDFWHKLWDNEKKYIVRKLMKGGNVMDKYKVLITGRNQVIMDDFFKYTAEYFDTISTSMRYEDINRHLDMCNLDIFVYCASSEPRNEILKLVSLKRKITRQNIVFVIIGSEEDCEDFQKIGIYMVDLALTKPISIDQIRERIFKFMHEKEEEEEETKEEKQHLEVVRVENRRKHVLIIDDDPTMLKLIKEYLHNNYQVATAISGKIAYKFLEMKKTDLILLDYEMPVENGPQILEKLRKNNLVNGVPVLFLTGITDRDKIKKALQMKPQGYLLKPIDKEKLLGTIEKYIGE
ncbi:MAG TPA: hypothetical protein DHV96_05550 [Lachnospiraceae bacterium]|nr:hypothetical protein [Lachnospiraceae bacterium]